MTDRMDYRQMPTRLQEFLVRRWLKLAKKEAVEFRVMAEGRSDQCFTTPISYAGIWESAAQEWEPWDSKIHCAVVFDGGDILKLNRSGTNFRCECTGWRPDCSCPPLVLLSYRREGSPDWHDFEDWLAQVGLDLRDEDEGLPDQVAA